MELATAGLSLLVVGPGSRGCGFRFVTETGLIKERKMTCDVNKRK